MSLIVFPHSSPLVTVFVYCISYSVGFVCFDVDLACILVITRYVNGTCALFDFLLFSELIKLGFDAAMDMICVEFMPFIVVPELSAEFDVFARIDS